MRNFALVATLFATLVASAGEPVALRLEIHGRTPLHVQPVDSPGYGLLGAGVFVGEPVIATVTGLNIPTEDKADWTGHLKWTVTTESGEFISVMITPVADYPVETTHFTRLTRPDAVFANFKFETFPPGRYVVEVRWAKLDKPYTDTASRRLLAVYRGDEEPRVRSFFLREQARLALKEQTIEAYRRARTMLLEAAEGNSDPSVYEELADASAPWAAPEETLAHYQRSLDIARQNLERSHGPRRDWPPSAFHLYEPRARKVDAFRTLVPYYRTNFDQIRVVVVRDGMHDKFAVERRTDGTRVRIVDPQQR